jgi:hypothetical protein
MAKGLSNTQRTLRALRERGQECAIVEKWNAFGGGKNENGEKRRVPGIRVDLFGIIDVLALDPQRGVVGVQSCGSSFSEHFRKLTVEKCQETINWLSTPGTKLELWSWRKVKVQRGGKAMRWSPRIREITLEDVKREDV